jgi:Zn-dependent peptidase ImmA (M78 family)
LIPETVNVAGINYKVIEKEYIEINGGRNYQGSCSYHNGQIEVLNDLHKDRKEQVFVHELVHAIFHEAGFEEQDEDMVNRLGIVFYQVLKNNKLYFGVK